MVIEMHNLPYHNIIPAEQFCSTSELLIIYAANHIFFGKDTHEDFLSQHFPVSKTMYIHDMIVKEIKRFIHPWKILSPETNY